MKIVSQAWHIEPKKEGDPTMVIYNHDDKQWYILGETLYDCAVYKPNKKGMLAVYKYYMANRTVQECINYLKNQ